MKARLCRPSVLALWLVPILSHPPAIHAQDCPPWFFTSLPRDREWFYGVARDKDVGKARDLAVINLAKNAVGLIGEWDERQIAEIVGPGYDAKEVAKEVGAILPTTGGLLAGWEQDDGGRCNGESYVLVRIEKDQVKKFLAENDKLKARLRKAAALPGMRKANLREPPPSDRESVENLIHTPPLPEFHEFKPRNFAGKTVGEALAWGLMVPGGAQLYAAGGDRDERFKGWITFGLTGTLVYWGIAANQPSSPRSSGDYLVQYHNRSKGLAIGLFSLAGVVDLYGLLDGVRSVTAYNGAWSIAPEAHGVEVAWSRRF